MGTFAVRRTYSAAPLAAEPRRDDGDREANSPEDVESSNQIRMHLKHIAMMFAEGNFNAPMLVHDQTPPGVPVMRELKDEIKYNYEEIGRGAAVRISTTNPIALKAIHEFLRFQIKEHKTGDSLDTGKRTHN